MKEDTVGGGTICQGTSAGQGEQCGWWFPTQATWSQIRQHNAHWQSNPPSQSFMRFEVWTETTSSDQDYSTAGEGLIVPPLQLQSRLMTILGMCQGGGRGETAPTPMPPFPPGANNSWSRSSMNLLFRSNVTTAKERQNHFPCISGSTALSIPWIQYLQCLAVMLAT